MASFSTTSSLKSIAISAATKLYRFNGLIISSTNAQVYYHF